MNHLPLQASDELQKKLRKISKPLRLAKSSVLFEQGEMSRGVFLIESGSVALMLKRASGGTVHERILGKGSVLGLPATVNHTTYSLTAEALGDVDLFFVPSQDLIEAMVRNVYLAVEILKVLSDEVHGMREVIRAWGRPGGSARKMPKDRKRGSYLVK